MKKPTKKAPKGYPSDEARYEALQANRARYRAKRTLMGVSFNTDLEQDRDLLEYAKKMDCDFSSWAKELLADELRYKALTQP